MGNFIDELKRNMQKQEEEKRRLEAQVDNAMIPENELKQMVDIMVGTIKKDISYKVYHKAMTYDLGGFRKKAHVNHRYEFSKEWTPRPVDSLSFTGITENHGYLVPTSKYFFECWDDLWYFLWYINEKHIDQLFTALVEKLRQDSINSTYEIYTKTEHYKGGTHKEISLKAWIKCDKNGNI